MADLPAPDFAGFLARLTTSLEAAQLPFMLIGGQAVLLHGQPRLTEDIDVTLAVDTSRLPAVRDVCAQLGLTPMPRDVERFVRETYVLPASDPETGMRVDFIFSTTPYERQAVARAVHVELGGARVPFATAEDLILHKLFAGRPRDLEDALGVAQRQGAALDWSYIRDWAGQFQGVPGKEDLPDRVEALRTDAATQ